MIEYIQSNTIHQIKYTVDSTYKMGLVIYQYKETKNKR